jgi:phosphatidylglycerol:prolipoprotein diacylglycerol transferase
MFPEIFRIPGIDVTIHAYGTLIVLAFLLGSWWAKRTAARRLGADAERVFNVCFVMLFVGIFGARLVHAFGHYAEFTARPMAFLAIWEGGLVLYGGVVACLLFLFWYLPRRPELGGFGLLDVLARGTALALVLGWFASLLAGDDYGKVTESALGIPVSAFRNGTPAAGMASGWGGDAAAKLHASPIYGSVFALVLFVGLGLVQRRQKTTGRTAAWFLILHSLGTALLELLRGDGLNPAAKPGERPFFLGDSLSWGQFLAIPVFFAGIALLLIRRPTRTSTAAPASGG